MESIFEISVAFLAIFIFIAHLIFYKRSGAKEPMMTYKLYLGLLLSPKIFFPLNPSFKDSPQTKRNKRKSNMLLAYFYILLVIEFIMSLIFENN